MRKIFVGVAVLAVIAVIAGMLLIGNLDKIVKGAIEGIGSELLGTRVSVASVEIELKDGSGRISGFSVANPAGFSSKKAFQADLIGLGLDLGSLNKQPLVVKELSIQKPVVRLDVREDGSSNLKMLLDNIEKNSAGADKKAAGRRAESKNVPAGEPVRISFGKLAVTGVNVYASVPGRDPETVAIPDLVMRNVGGEEGLTPSEIGQVVIGEVINQSLQAVIKKKMTEKVEEAAKGFLGDLKKKILPKDRK